MAFAVTKVFAFEPGFTESIVATMLAVILLPEVTVILRVPVSTVYKLAGIISPTVYGDVPELVTTTLYFSALDDVLVAAEIDSPVPIESAGDAEVLNACASYNLL